MDPARCQELLSSENPEERRRATASLAALTGPAAVEALLRALGDVDWRVRKEAVTAAVEMAADPVVLQALVEVLASRDEDVGRRNAAVEALAGFGIAAVDALGVVMPRLDADGRKLAAEALGSTGSDAAVPVLRTLVGDADVNVRVAAVEALAALGATSVDSVVPVLEAVLQAPEPMLRLAALMGLNSLGVAVPLARIASWLGDPVLRPAVLVAFGRQGDPAAAPLLVEVLERVRGPAREQVFAALADYARASPAALAAARAAFAALGSDVAPAILDGAERAEPVERRRRFVSLLGLVGTVASARTAVRALGDEAVASAAEEALLAIGEPALGPVLDHVRAGPSETRAICVALAGQLAPPGEQPALIQALHGLLEAAEPGDAAAALRVLAALGDAGSLAHVARHLDDSSPWVRRAATEAMAGLAVRHPREAAALVVGASPDGPGALAAALVMGVVDEPVRPGEGADVAFLVQALSHGDPLVRRAVLEALARRGGAGAVDAVVFALGDEEVGVRVAAARALGRMRDSGGASVGVEPLLDFVSRGTERELVAEAVRALGETASPQAVPLLRRQVRDGAPVVAVAAVEAVARLESPERVDALLEGIWHEDPEVVKVALRCLAEEVDPRVRPHLTACLDHDAWGVRRLAADLLARRGGEGVTARLKTRLVRETEPLVREAIQRALLEIETASAGIRRTTTSPPMRGGPEGA